MSLRPVPPTLPSLSDTPTDEQVCNYISEMCVELRQLAKLRRLSTISYLLDMARLEAERAAKTLTDQGLPPR